jgi:predicted CopG family antitoxin
MNRFVERMEDVKRELSDDIDNLKRLAEVIPQLLERKQRQLDRLAEVASSMQQEDVEVETLIARYTELRPARARGSRGRGRTLPTDIMALLHAAGPRGASLDELFDGLSKTRHVHKQNLSSTLSRMKSQGKIAKADGMFVPS